MRVWHLFLAAGLLVWACEDDPPAGDTVLVKGDAEAPLDAGVDGQRPNPIDATPADAGPALDAGPVVDATPDLGPPVLVHRAPCFEGTPTDPALTPLARDCVDLFERRADLESGCYVLDDGLGAPTGGYCWRKRVLVLLVNNEIETPPHPNDVDQDGVIDDGEFAGTNFPPDPFALTPAEVGAEMRRQVHDYFTEMSYGALSLEVNDVHYARGEDGAPDRWFRLQRERPSFANDDLFRAVCLQRGGMTLDDWRSFDIIVTVVNYGTAISGSQGRDEALPIGPDCMESEVLWNNYVVMKGFRGWHRLGTLFHELTHALARDPASEPSIGHSEAIHAETEALAEYGDLSDLMGESSSRGQLSLPQRLFLRYLPPTAIDVIEAETPYFAGRVHPLETRTLERKGVRIPVAGEDAYYVEARRHIGNDQRLPHVFKHGVLVKRGKRIDRANKSYIVDATPETPSARSTDSVLFPGRTVADVEKQIFISVVSSDQTGADVVVRREPASVAPPTEISIAETPIEGGGIRLQATAQPGDPSVDPADLLFFWKLGPRDAPYTGRDYGAGMTLTPSADALDGEIWLVVSDQRGGETWTAVRPAP